MLTAATDGTSASLWVPLASIGAATIAALVALVSVYFQRKSGRETAAVARRSVEIAEAAVAVNERTAIGVARRAEADARSKRYQDAAAQLGHQSPAVRLAGIYAMAHLADEWPEQRQACVDVLCAYLRMPTPPRGDDDHSPSEAQVRRAVQAVIANRVSRGRAEETWDQSDGAWSGSDFDLSGARLVDFELVGCTFRGDALFDDATFEGDCGLHDVAFFCGASFKRSTITGLLVLDEVRSYGPDKVGFHQATIAPDGRLSMSTNLLVGELEDPQLWGLRVHGELSVSLYARKKPLPDVDLSGLAVWGRVRLGGWSPSGLFAPEDRDIPVVQAFRWRIASGSTIEVSKRLRDNDHVRGLDWNTFEEVQSDGESIMRRQEP